MHKWNVYEEFIVFTGVISDPPMEKIIEKNEMFSKQNCNKVGSLASLLSASISEQRCMQILM